MGYLRYYQAVSTHSRLKAAGAIGQNVIVQTGFNTQPPEGGCKYGTRISLLDDVSTHSRLKAAETMYYLGIDVSKFQHTAA